VLSRAKPPLWAHARQRRASVERVGGLRQSPRAVPLLRSSPRTRTRTPARVSQPPASRRSAASTTDTTTDTPSPTTRREGTPPQRRPRSRHPRQRSHARQNASGRPRPGHDHACRRRRTHHLHAHLPGAAERRRLQLLDARPRTRRLPASRRTSRRRTQHRARRHTERVARGSPRRWIHHPRGYAPAATASTSPTAAPKPNRCRTSRSRRSTSALPADAAKDSSEPDQR
jgi:hypothetical protein